MLKLSNYFKKNFLCTLAQMLNEKKSKFYKPYTVKKAIYPATKGRKYKVLNWPIDLKSINKVPISVGKSPNSRLVDTLPRDPCVPN